MAGQLPEGFVEVLSSDFALGWAQTQMDRPAHVYARLEDEIIGTARADIFRADLATALPSADPAASILSGETGSETELHRAERRNAFVIPFDNPVPADRLIDVTVHTMHSPRNLERSGKLRLIEAHPLQIFILGSPRSGTSEMAATLAKVLRLPWLGESHVAPLFAQAADALSGDRDGGNRVLQLMSEQSMRSVVTTAFRKFYYYAHGSSSFLDKTPGVPTIKVAPFLHECFPTSKVIYLRRNGISNVLSRMKKFGGNFSEHCADWAAAITSWDDVKDKVPSYVEIDQEAMLADPDGVALKVASYLGIAHAAGDVAASFRAGTNERTGAGIGHATLTSTDWDDTQKAVFRATCGTVMSRHGYSMD